MISSAKYIFTQKKREMDQLTSLIIKCVVLQRREPYDVSRHTAKLEEKSCYVSV